LDDFGFNSALFQSQVVRPLHCGFDVGDFNTPHGDAKRDLCEQFKWAADSRICLFVGRLDGIDPSQPLWNHKNPQFALDAVHHSIANDPRIKFVIVGGGEDARTSLEARVREWGLSDVIRFVGSRLDVPQFMAAADLLLFPSSEEGLGMVAVEAQAAGLRVLASATVPHEAVVLEELVTFRSLDEGPASWGAEVCRLLDLPRFDVARASNAVQESEFSVHNSYRALHNIYASRTRGLPPSRASRKRK
jgi:glycosyltransferase involved in cell wall biosynthesis